MTRSEYLDLQTVFEKDGQMLAYTISNIIRGNVFADKNTLVATAYVLHKANNEAVSVNSIDEFCKTVNASDNRKAFLETYIGDIWQMVAGQRYRYNVNSLKALILFIEGREIKIEENRTPDSLANLAIKLLNLQEGEKLADFGSGSGSFMVNACLDNHNVSYIGIDINANLLEIASIRLEIIGCDAEMLHSNIFELDPEDSQYDKVFANYPFGLKYKEIGFERYRLVQKILANTCEFSKGVSSDWFFNSAIMECLKENGKGIAIMTNGSTWNTLDKSARKYFIENGYLEAVVSLPERMFEAFNIPTTMVVLSHNNDKVMLVDATSMCEKGRRFNTFTDDQIEKILFALKNNTENSRYISMEELSDNDYVINPTRYLTEEIVVENGCSFGSIMKSISRGAPIKASDLDEMVSDKPTDYQYLTLGNIQKGQIDEQLPYIKGIDESQKKYCISNHSLILSKNGAPYKVAVAEVPEGKTILANGNLYVIELDEEKVDPYYVKMFLESQKGLALLKSIAVGSSIPNISVESLRKIQIPVIPLEEQKKLMIKYQAKMDEIRLFQSKLQKAYEELNHLYDSEG